MTPTEAEILRSLAELGARVERLERRMTDAGHPATARPTAFGEGGLAIQTPRGPDAMVVPTPLTSVEPLAGVDDTGVFDLEELAPRAAVPAAPISIIVPPTSGP